jgi:outer membrane protein assembly factor BamB
VLVAAGALAGCGSSRPTVRQLPSTGPLTLPLTVSAPPKQSSALPWPTYGAGNARLRAVAAPRLRPPFRRLWTFHGKALLEFPPVVGYGSLFEEAFDGRLFAIDPATGRVRWRYYAPRCGWSSPALGGGLVFATFIAHPSCHAHAYAGAIVAFTARDGHVVWHRRIGPCESSPLVANGLVYIGDQDGYVYAFDARTGRPRWSFNTGAPIKASPTLAYGRIYIGNYAGAFFALDARSGRLVWRQAGYGNFYSTASVSAGRVYVGSLDENVYALSARTGERLWTFGTRSYVYASPAVWRGLVLVGSYDGGFYALRAEDGSLRWIYRTGASISGAASVIGGVVYFSTLAHKTYALAAGGGRLLEQWPDGEYSPAVAGIGRLYLVGVGRIYALAPR